MGILMRALVTGGAGFIGSHLADGLVRDGHVVTVFDNESTGRRENVPASARYVRGGITSLHELELAFEPPPDLVMHVVGQVSLINSYFHPLQDLRTNVEGTLCVLQLCLKYRVPRLLYASSMTVYGDTQMFPIAEDAACHPISYYGIAKYAAERYVHATAERVDLEVPFAVTSFRMFNVYGPRQALNNPYQGVLGIFLGRVLRDEPLTIFGDGEQSRDFVYIDDVVEAWLGAIDNPRTYGQVFNLGSGHALSINELADRVLAAVGRDRKSNIVSSPARSGEQRHVQADVSRARSLLGWTCKTPFDAGLSRTALWARQQMQLAP
jgi:UDP-glucose 4-epimerase